MYIPEHFRMPDADVRAFLQQVRTGTLITTDLRTRRPLATFLPWVMTGDDRLTSHMGSVNPQSHDSDPDAEALVILMGYDGFVPADWMGPGAAPTLDYETVHVYGHLTTHTDADWILQSWDDLLRTFSHTTLQEYDHDWLVKNARAVVGIEIDITEIQAKSKLSQNRSAPEALSIADHLQPACPHLAARIREVSLPHIAAREERVRNAVAYKEVN